MIPGLTNGPPFPERAVKNAVVAVADIRFPSVPTFVGVCEVDVSSLGSVQGAKGHAVRGIQWEGDELWSWSTSGRRGQPSPAELDGWYCTEEEPSQGLESLRLNENDATPMAKEDGEKTDLSERPEEDGTDTAGEPEKEPTTKGNPFYPLLNNNRRQSC